MVELIDAGRNMLDELPTGLCQPDASRMALEQQNAKVLLQRLHASTNARQADAECVRSVPEVQIFGDSERLNEGR
jgi:hypothetical protein